ncbi:TPA: NUDIX hydrolase, partial [Candidatus Taylorbacteria bacterium]|nr:NUDIX hydrolase [Candidatus Taylorbacteria bacterium]
MTKKFSNAEYYAQLPKKQTGTAVLFFNSKSELLIVKPNYKEGWLVPGGAIEDRESPLQGAIREVKEEIGLDIPELKLIGVYYRTGNEIFGDSLKFIFS